MSGASCLILLRLVAVSKLTTTNSRNAFRLYSVISLRLRQVFNLDTYLIRNTLTICFLPAGVAAVNRVRPLGGKGFSADLADQVLAFFQPPLFQILLVAPVPAQTIIAIFLGGNLRIENTPASFTDDFPDNIIRPRSGDFFFIPLFQLFLIFIFPVAVPHGFVPSSDGAEKGGTSALLCPCRFQFYHSGLCYAPRSFRILRCASLWQASQQYFTSLLVVVNAFPQFPQTHSRLLPAAASCR